MSKKHEAPFVYGTTTQEFNNAPKGAAARRAEDSDFCGHADTRYRDLSDYQSPADWLAEELKRSGISVDLATRCGVRLTNPGEARTVLGWTHGDDPAGILFPYNSDYVRVKPREPRQPAPLFVRHVPVRAEPAEIHAAPVRQAEVKAPPKYLGPIGKQVPAYTRAVEVSGVKSDFVAIVEGEKKALAGCAAGIETIGLGGVDCGFVSGTDPAQLLPELAERCRGRRVVVFFDTPDMDEKPGVIRAAVKLARHIAVIATTVEIGFLPAVKDEKKTGFDDLWVSLQAQPNPAVAFCRELTFAFRIPCTPARDDAGKLELAPDGGCVFDPSDAEVEIGNDEDPEIAREEAQRLVNVTHYASGQQQGNKVRYRLAKNLDVQLRAALTETAAKGLTPLDAEVERWAARRGVGINADGRFAISPEDINRLTLDVATDIKKSGAALESLRFRACKKMEEEWCDGLAFNRGAADLVPTWVRAVTGDVKPTDVAVVKHFLWMVKRTALGLSIENHIFPIVCSPDGIGVKQRSGKSTAVKKLLDPARPYIIPNNDVSLLTDDRYQHQLAENLVVFCDEMAKVERADEAKLKNIVTTETVSWRVMRTTTTVSQPKRASFIGTANWQLEDLVKDTTGNRRFFQLTSLRRCDWDAINDINYYSLWRSIDEGLPHGYLVCDVLDAVAAEQENHRVLDAFEDWVGAMVRPGGTKEVTATEAYAAFQAWCYANGRQHPITSNSFGRKLKACLKACPQPDVVRVVHSKTMYLITISADAHPLDSDIPGAPLVEDDLPAFVPANYGPNWGPQ